MDPSSASGVLVLENTEKIEMNYGFELVLSLLLKAAGRLVDSHRLGAVNFQSSSDKNCSFQ